MSPSREEFDKQVQEIRKQVEAQIEQAPSFMREALRAQAEAAIIEKTYQMDAKLMEEELVKVAASRGYVLEYAAINKNHGGHTSSIWFYNHELLEAIPAGLRPAVLMGWAGLFKDRIKQKLKSLVGRGDSRGDESGDDHPLKMALAAAFQKARVATNPDDDEGPQCGHEECETAWREAKAASAKAAEATSEEG